MTNPHGTDSLDYDYLEALGPKRVKDTERDDRGSVRINSLWMTGDELRPALHALAEAKERERVAFNEDILRTGGEQALLKPEGVKLLYTKREDGTLIYGAEDIADLLPAEDYQRLVDGVAKNRARRDLRQKARLAFRALVRTGKLPSLAELDNQAADIKLRAGLHGQGHVGMAGKFTPAGGMVAAPSRQSGEIWYYPNEKQGVANDKSGRYMSEGVRPKATFEELNRALTNVAKDIAADLGIPVRPEMIKNSGKAPGNNPYSGFTAGPVANPTPKAQAKPAKPPALPHRKAPDAPQRHRS